jgi:hypothetical protein
MTPFFVTGYPRSRTAWWAAFLSTGPVLCLHDPTAWCDPLEPPVGRGERFGIADSGLATYAQALFEKWPGAPLLVVRRPREESFRSFCSWLPAETPLPAAQAGFSLVAGALDTLLLARPYHEILYTDLDDPLAVAEAWSFLLPDIPFSAARWEIFSRLRIETGGHPWVG